MGSVNAYGRTPEERFWAKVDRSGGPDSCWPWSGRRQRTGYGIVTIAQRKLGAHRVALGWAIGRPLVSNEVARHLVCDNPPCVNPAHLAVGSNIDNNRDKVEKGRSNRGERHGNARLTEDQVLEIRRLADGGRAHSAIAKDMGLSRRLVSRIASRERWVYLP